jgi:hypothetical protein
MYFVYGVLQGIMEENDESERVSSSNKKDSSVQTSKV